MIEDMDPRESLRAFFNALYANEGSTLRITWDCATRSWYTEDPGPVELENPDELSYLKASSVFTPSVIKHLKMLPGEWCVINRCGTVSDKNSGHQWVSRRRDEFEFRARKMKNLSPDRPYRLYARYLPPKEDQD